MCGISGWIGYREQSPPDLRLGLLSHRGPDDWGEERYVSASGRVAAVLGATRLSIIDLSLAGHMPMEHSEEPLSLVFNGEIYNFPELRRELEQLGEGFRSRTDTEVILNGYRVWGDGVTARLRGMFAFALWDGREDGRLLLARDRFGKKPLYFRTDKDQGLAFSSELKTLIRKRTREVDPEALDYYLDRGYPPPDRSLLKGFAKVRSGSVMIWERGALQEQRFWDFPATPPAWTGMSRREAGAALGNRLEGAVRRRLVADVPLGLLLSGGVDSSSILAFMAKMSPEPVLTYTACFGGTNLDESETARQTARSFGARHHALLINPRCGRLLPYVASQMDEPIADPSAVATYLICRRARQEVTVLLSGDGSDELLLGYPRYRLHALSQLLTRVLPPALRKGLAGLLPPWSLPERALSAPADPLLRDRYWLDHSRRRRDAFVSGDRPWTVAEAVYRVLREDVSSWLVEDILMKLDKMSMAVSLEVRVPFLDQEVAELALRLPFGARWSLTTGKSALREAMRRETLPHLSWSRKQPFHLPIDDWLRCEWRPLVQDVLLDARTLARGWVDPKEMRRLLEEQFAGHARHGRRLYQLLVLELWARSLLDRGEAEPRPASVEDCARELDPGRPLRKLAVIAPAGIGDTLRLTPGLKRLYQADPNVSVTLYVNEGRGADQVMAGYPPVDRHVLIPFAKEGLGKYRRLLRDLRRLRPECLASTLVSRFAGLLGALSGVKDRRGWVPQWSLAMRWGGWGWRRRVPYHPTQLNAGPYDTAAFCHLLEIPVPDNPAPIMAPPLWEERALTRVREKLHLLPRPILAVNAVAQASIRQRQYPLALLAGILRELLRQGVINSCLLLGDQSSRQGHGFLRVALGPRGLDLAGMLSLPATGAILRESDAVLTIDGGLLHMALATPVPVIALFGPTEIYSQDPRGLNRRYRVLSAYDRCRCECLNHRGIRVREECRQDSQCLASIPPDLMVTAVRELLAEKGHNGRGQEEPR